MGYRGLTTWQDDTKAQASKRMYSETWLGRRRYLRGIGSKDWGVKSFAERCSLNTPIQGSAADIMKIAMIKVDEYLTINNYKTTLILQVHDELIFALDDNEHHIIDEIVDIMENIFALPLKLKVGVSTGKDWFSAS